MRCPKRLLDILKLMALKKKKTPKLSSVCIYMYVMQSSDQFSQMDIFGNLRFKVLSLLKLGMCKPVMLIL